MYTSLQKFINDCPCGDEKTVDFNTYHKYGVALGVPIISIDTQPHGSLLGECLFILDQNL